VSLSKSTVRGLISDSSFPLFLLLVGSFFLTVFFRISASVVLPLEGERLGMSAAMIGFISSVHFYAYAFLQPVSGILHDRYGPVRVVISGLLLTAGSCLLLTFVRTPFTLGAWRLLSGFGVAPMYSAVLVFQAFAFPPERYCFYAAINMGLSSLGAIVSVAPLGFAVDTFGMTGTFALLSAIPLAMALVLARRAPADPIRLSAAGKEARSLFSIFPGIGQAILFIMKNRRVRALQTLWAISSASLLTFQGLWGVSWFAAAFNASPGSARFWSSLVSVGMMMGPVFTSGVVVSPAGLPGIIRKVSTANAVSWFLLLAATGWGGAVWVGGLAAFTVGMTSGMRGVFSLAAITAVSPPGSRGSVFGAMNMTAVLSAVVFQWGTGIIIDHFPGEAPGTFTAAGYFAGFTVVAFAMAASLFALHPLGREPLVPDTGEDGKS
jgi:MFS family permease